jgi:DNA-binding MarR family transcriptional regulator
MARVIIMTKENTPPRAINSSPVYPTSFAKKTKEEQSLSKSDLIDMMLSDILGIRAELKKLREDVFSNLHQDRQRIMELENKNKSFGKVVNDRVAYMLDLINNYGGSMTSTMIKKQLALTKDELYRTVKCAKERGLIDISPNPRDRRGYIVIVRSKSR